MQHEEETQRLNQPTGEDEYKPLEGLETKLHANSRKNFVSKVYGILCAQLLLTCAFVTLGVVNDAVNMFLRTNVVLLVVSFVVSLITIYSLSCYKSLARSVPTNYILLFIFTAAETYMV
jgi:FtsH-binding integral membrane protein